MSTRTFLFVSLILAFLQGTFLPSSFLEGLLVLMYLLDRKPKESLAPLFFSGLIFDLVGSNLLGLTSAVFLGQALVVYLVSLRFPITHPLIFAGIVLFEIFSRNFLLNLSPNTPALVVAFLISVFSVKFFRIRQGLYLR